MKHFLTSLWLAFAVLLLAGCNDADDPKVPQPAAPKSAAPLAAAPQPVDEAESPLGFEFKQPCGLPAGRQRVYDPNTGIFHIHFGSSKPIGSGAICERNAFEVKKILGPFVRPVVFRLTGVPLSYGCLGDPLALNIGRGASNGYRLEGRSYALVADPLASGPIDKSLFRIERNDDVLIVAFTEKGQALLQPGAMISFRLDFGW
jgi:hypothetical protein